LGQAIDHLDHLSKVLPIGRFIEGKRLLFQVSPHHLDIEPTLANDQLKVVTRLPTLAQTADHLLDRQRLRGTGGSCFKHGNRPSTHVKAQSLQSVMGTSTSIMVAIQ